MVLIDDDVTKIKAFVQLQYCLLSLFVNRICPVAAEHTIKKIVNFMNTNRFRYCEITLGAVYMSQANPVRQTEFSHDNIFMTVTDKFNQLYDFLTTKLS